MSHQIKIENFDRFYFNYSLASSFGNGENKELLCIVEPVRNIISYELRNKREIVLVGYNLHEAIELYNKL